ncbi:MAG: hypothetical protein OXE76_08360 [Alphaproteobacteria bacterium]|nr:hypothetical protein [Alphaproteobacteria bacterium]
MAIYYYRPAYVALALATGLALSALLALLVDGLAAGKSGPPLAMAALLAVVLGGIACYAVWIICHAHLPAVVFDKTGIAFPIFGIAQRDWSAIRAIRQQSLLSRNELIVYFEPPAPVFPWVVAAFGGFWRSRKASHLRFNMKRMNCGRDSLDYALREYPPLELRSSR